MSLTPGEFAPEFILPDADGNLVSLSQFRGKRVILFFYPRDNTPGCTTEACGFRDLYREYQARDLVILGVSADDAQSHAQFARKYQLPFPLLSDTDGKVATTYGSYGLKKFMGREFMGVYRNTFIINPKGYIEQIHRQVKPSHHAAKILKELS
ncbi:MAG: thioredoxin-dependent thiol peroxidase [Microcoleaceae cyanobacterium]